MNASITEQLRLGDFLQALIELDLQVADTLEATKAVPQAAFLSAPCSLMLDGLGRRIRISAHTNSTAFNPAATRAAAAGDLQLARNAPFLKLQ